MTFEVPKFRTRTPCRIYNVDYQSLRLENTEQQILMSFLFFYIHCGFYVCFRVLQKSLFVKLFMYLRYISSRWSIPLLRPLQLINRQVKFSFKVSIFFYFRMLPVFKTFIIEGLSHEDVYTVFWYRSQWDIVYCKNQNKEV